MQAKISAFFKPSESRDNEPSRLSISIPEITVTYKRRNPKVDSKSDESCHAEEIGIVSNQKMNDVLINCAVDSRGRILNKKRSYAQYHLELGQSDFLLRTCPLCDLKYACGDEDDEKLHKEFHQKYHQGIQFKGWQNERVISTLSSNGERIILVLDGDPPSRKNKVREVAKLMEKDLGSSDGWLLHNLCKVYLYILNHKIVGCLVAEPVKTAYKVISHLNGGNPKATRSNTASFCAQSKEAKSKTNDLHFGSVRFKREILRKSTSSIDTAHKDIIDSILLQEEEEEVQCGIRAIWVAPSQRRNHIATRLLDSVRRTFCLGRVLESSECAFSQPTSAGKALAARYFGTDSFLVYKAEIKSA